MSRRLLVYGDPPPVAAGLDASTATAPNTTEPAAPESATPRPFRLSPVPGASCASCIRTASARILGDTPDKIRAIFEVPSSPHAIKI